MADDGERLVLVEFGLPWPVEPSLGSILADHKSFVEFQLRWWEGETESDDNDGGSVTKEAPPTCCNDFTYNDIPFRCITVTDDVTMPICKQNAALSVFRELIVQANRGIGAFIFAKRVDDHVDIELLREFQDLAGWNVKQRCILVLTDESINSSNVRHEVVVNFSKVISVASCSGEQIAREILRTSIEVVHETGGVFDPLPRALSVRYPRAMSASLNSAQTDLLETSLDLLKLQGATGIKHMEAVTHLLSDLVPSIRYGAIQVLRKLGSIMTSTVGKALAHLLADPLNGTNQDMQKPCRRVDSGTVRLAVVDALGCMSVPPADVVNLVSRLLYDRRISAPGKASAIDVVGRWGLAHKHADQLEELHKHESHEIRKAVLTAFSTLGSLSSSAASLVRASLQDNNAGVRCAALDSIACCSPIDVDAFEGMLQDSCETVRKTAFHHLVSHAPRTTMLRLIERACIKPMPAGIRDHINGRSYGCPVRWAIDHLFQDECVGFDDAKLVSQLLQRLLKEQRLCCSLSIELMASASQGSRATEILEVMPISLEAQLDREGLGVKLISLLGGAGPAAQEFSFVFVDVLTNLADKVRAKVDTHFPTRGSLADCVQEKIIECYNSGLESDFLAAMQALQRIDHNVEFWPEVSWHLHSMHIDVACAAARMFGSLRVSMRLLCKQRLGNSCDLARMVLSCLLGSLQPSSA